ncbi:amino acid-binding protein [Croceicoccus estronivorus]|uniref:glycine cleavage system protein R n=1 Tax=Croceicoccus estronivorus TaxID=1172626 RepID=UPI00082BA0D7|nr:ACT domain-containing protein [Croceicoccus estronivorus]OCC22497.1 amino acid-binding protein [Croceicoccus estronivorus]
MTSRVILSVAGSDRPGLTQALADAVLEAGGNWLESHLSRLGGTYVGSVLVELDPERLPALESHIHAVDASGLRVTIVPAGDEPQPEGKPLWIELVGQDRRGIVREVTGVLTALGVNIEDFSTGTENSAWSGELLFRMNAVVIVPRGTTAEDVQSALEAISGEIMVDFTFSPPDN